MSIHSKAAKLLKIWPNPNSRVYTEQSYRISKRFFSTILILSNSYITCNLDDIMSMYYPMGLNGRQSLHVTELKLFLQRVKRKLIIEWSPAVLFFPENKSQFNRKVRTIFPTLSICIIFIKNRRGMKIAYLIQNERCQTASLLFFENESNMSVKEILHFSQFLRRGIIYNYCLLIM